jgi:hypothetical protein
MGQPYISKVTILGHCPTCEPDKQDRIEVTLGQFIKAPDGKSTPVEFETVTPEKAATLGLPIDKFLGDVAGASLRERDQAQAALSKARADLEAAINEKTEAEKAAGQLQRKLDAQKAASADRETRLRSEIERLKETLRTRYDEQRRKPVVGAEANDLKRVRLDGTATAEQLARHDEIISK